MFETLEDMIRFRNQLERHIDAIVYAMVLKGEHGHGASAALAGKEMYLTRLDERIEKRQREERSGPITVPSPPQDLSDPVKARPPLQAPFRTV